MSQSDLFIAPPPRKRPIVMSPRERFEWFHQQNPGVYRELVRLCREAKAAGAKRIGIRLVWERMRWLYSFEVKDPNQTVWKLNDHYPPFYARLIAEREPDLSNFFELRTREVSP